MKSIIKSNTKSFFFYNWHYVLFVSLIAYSLKEFKTSRPSVAKIISLLNIKADIEVSNENSNHLPHSQFLKVWFEQPILLKSGNQIEHKHWSAWYKIKFESIPENLVLDFYNYETVIGLDCSGQFINNKTVETGSNSTNHNRHAFFDFKVANAPSTYYFKVFTKTFEPEDSLQICLINSKSFYGNIHDEFYENQFFTYWMFFVIGGMFFQGLYIGSLAWSRRKKEYIYYLLFVLVGFINLIIAHRFELGYIGYFKILPTSSIVMYLAICNLFLFKFQRYYLNTREDFPFLDAQYKQAELFLLVGTITNCLIYFISQDLEYTYSFFLPMTICIIVNNFYIICLLYLEKSPLIKYLMFGFAFTAVMMIFRLIINFIISEGWMSEVIDFDGLVLIFGLVVDSMCLNLGLNYKHRLEIMEKQNALEKAKKNIASDLHDDLGSGLSSIKLLSERAWLSIDFLENKNQIEKILKHSSILIENLAVIVWSMDNRYNKLSNLLEQMRDFTGSLSDIQSFDWRIERNITDFQDISVSPEFKKNIYLIFKETVNNAVKYAQSDVVEIDIAIEDNCFKMRIIDFGKGFDKNSVSHSFGIVSICNRAKTLNGSAQIQSEINKGTIVEVQVPLPK